MRRSKARFLWGMDCGIIKESGSVLAMGEKRFKREKRAF